MQHNTKILYNFRTFLMSLALVSSLVAVAQKPVTVGKGSYASFAPLAESRTDEHGGSQAYNTEHRRLFLPDSLLHRLSAADGSSEGMLALPTNDWWTYALVNKWTGKLWAYPMWVEATANGIDIALPDYWEPTGCEMKWTTTLHISAPAFHPAEALVDSWGDYHMSFTLNDGDKWVRCTVMHGSPLTWIETSGLALDINNPDETKYAVFHNGSNYAVGVLTEGLASTDLEPYAFRIPRHTRVNYKYDRSASELSTSFHVGYEDKVATSVDGVIMGFLPHQHRASVSSRVQERLDATFATPRGEMKVFRGNDFTFNYTVHGMLPYFPAPAEDLAGYDRDRMHQLISEYAAGGSFGADTYWGGKGLTQMAHYMTFAMQMGDEENFDLARRRLKENLINWYTYTPGETDFFFARFPRFGALVGFDPSYDSETFNDHHFHYGYFVYASALLCLVDEEFRRDYGPMAREVARDYANWQRQSNDEPWFRTLDPYCGHSFAGGMGNQGNGNGQESTSEAMQGWGGVWMLGAALGDEEMLEAGVFGYTLEARGTAEYWFDRSRQNIDYTKYQHPYNCNLTMQGVGWWTWFSGDPVWMHSIQWLPISPILTNYLSEDLDFARWDYEQMYAKKEVGDYDAPSGGLGDESGLGNVCLSYLSLYDPDKALTIFDDMWNRGKALARNTDTGGITYWLINSHRTLGDKRYDILADDPLATAYTDKTSGVTTYAVYNTSSTEKTVRFWSKNDGGDVSWKAPAGQLSLFTNAATLTSLVLDGPDVVEPNTTAVFTLHYLDQYGASCRGDENISYSAPATEGTTTFSVTREGLTVEKALRIGALPYIAEATITPAIDFMEMGEEVVFTLEAKDQYGEEYAVEWEQLFAPTVPGQYEIKYSDEIKHVVTVLPPYPNVAIGKPVQASSYENVGTLPQYVNDGDYSTRWGSAHKDNESITIDLQSSHYINKVCVKWEAAYASRYELAMSDDGTNWQSVMVTAHGGTVTTDIQMNGRYLRLTGVERGTQYGTSCYEIEAFGVPLSGDDTALLGMAVFTDKDVLAVGEAARFDIRGYNRKAEEMNVTPTLSFENATLSGGQIVPLSAGTMTLRATVGSITATKTWTVMESETIATATITPAEVTIPLGDEHTFTVAVQNQFGYDVETTTFVYKAEELGDHIVPATLCGKRAEALVHVVEFSEVNLALGKQATASGAEGDGTSAEKAVDGNTKTRWSSRFLDDEWLEVDLGDVYTVNRVRMIWENAYATEYEVLVSTDDINFTSVLQKKGMKGGTQDFTFDPVNARYVKLLCHKRNTGYGSSLWEFEVYGIRHATTGVSMVTGDKRQASVRKVIIDGKVYILRDGRLYSTDGLIINNQNN